MKPLFQLKGFWNGEAKAIFTACIVKLQEDPEHPLWWQNAFAGKEWQAIEITYAGQTWRISNEDGTGFQKVTIGMGSPSCGHASFGAHEVLRYIPREEMTKKINREMVLQNAIAVKEYQKRKDPAEFEKLQSLEDSMRKYQRMTPEEQVRHINEYMMRPANPSKQFHSKLKKDGRGKR